MSKQVKKYSVKPATKAAKIKLLITNLLESGITDWAEIRTQVLSNSDFKITATEFKRAEKALLDKGIITFNLND